MNIDEIILYGLGLVSERCIEKLITDFKVPFIIDQKKCGTFYKEIPVLAYKDAAAKIKSSKKKIVIMTSQKVYSEIKKILIKDELVEYQDFCRVEQFAVEWYWEYRRKTNIFQVNTAVTTYCSLNCLKCNMFIPHYKERKHSSFEEMKEDMDLLLKNVDYIFLYMFLGGEPFLNPELHKIIAYAGQTYPQKIGRLSITTNAMVIPDDHTLDVLKNYDARVVISDYTAAATYRDKLDHFIEIMKKRNILYSMNETLEWKDFGFPDEIFDGGGVDKEQLRKHMLKCAPLFHGVNDGKFYYCHIIWSAEKAGIFENACNDYIDLKELDSEKLEDRRKLSQFSMGNWEKGYLDFCRFCGGCGEDNSHYVPIGEQIRRNS